MAVRSPRAFRRASTIADPSVADATVKSDGNRWVESPWRVEASARSTLCAPTVEALCSKVVVDIPCPGGHSNPAERICSARRLSGSALTGRSQLPEAPPRTPHSSGTTKKRLRPPAAAAIDRNSYILG